jgi:membrane associated rhomboid family serine protease
VEAIIWLTAAVLFVAVTVLSKEYVASTLGYSWTGIARWWSWGSYVLVHASLLHLTLVLYPIYLFGPRIERAWGSGRFFWFIALCIVGGWAAHSLLIRNDSLLIGGAAPAFGLMIAYAMQWPDEELSLFGVFPMKSWSLVGALVSANLAIGLFTGAAGEPGIAYFAHLGGAVAAWIYMRTPGSAQLEQISPRVARVPDMEEPPRAIPRSQPRARERLDEVDEIVARSKAVAAKRPTAPRQQSPANPEPPRSDELNRVLDKISAEGLDSLTEEERRVLAEMARRLSGHGP